MAVVNVIELGYSSEPTSAKALTGISPASPLPLSPILVEEYKGNPSNYSEEISSPQMRLSAQVTSIWWHALKKTLALAFDLRYACSQKARCIMTLGIRKLLVLVIVGAVFLAANILLVAHWLNEVGVVETAKGIREEFLTGTAITIIVALLILLVGPKSRGWRISRRQCPVCDHSISGNAKYCGECGSKV